MQLKNVKHPSEINYFGSPALHLETAGVALGVLGIISEGSLGPCRGFWGLVVVVVVVGVYDVNATVLFRLAC